MLGCYGATEFATPNIDRAASRFRGNHRYDLAADPGEETNLAGGAEETAAAARLAEALRAVEAPAAQFERLGL